MKKTKVSILGLIFILSASFATACHKSTKIEKEVTVGPDGNVLQETKVDREVKTGIEDEDVKVETKVELE